MRTQHHFLPELRHWLSGTKCGHATFMSMAFFGHYFYSGTHLVVHQRCFLYSPLLTWFFVFIPPSLTFFISSRNVSESTIHFLGRHKRKILIRIDTSTVYSTFDWDQFNQRKTINTAGKNRPLKIRRSQLRRSIKRRSV